MKTNNLYAQLSVGQGPVGPVGPQGPKGDKGDKGETGPVGPQGPKGDKGERGARGERGLTGPTGLQGERGAQGPEGQRGPQGPKGPKGDKGDKGDIGITPSITHLEEAIATTIENVETRAENCLPIIEESATAKVDYTGQEHKSLKDSMDANVDFVLGEVNRVHYEGQHITALDSIAGQAKNAVVEGNTLVNLIPEGRQSSFHINNTHGGGQAFWASPNVNMIKPSTKYLILTNVMLNTGSRIVINNNEEYVSCFTDGIYYEPNEVGIKKTILTSRSDLSGCATILRSYTHTIGEVKGTIQVFEYQEGMENWDIPYFTGMKSVQMPVLTTTGKNLFDKEAFYNDWKSKQEKYVYKEVVDGEEVLKIHNLNLLWPDNKGFKIPVEKGIPLTLTLKCKKAGTTNTSMVLMVRHGDSSYVSLGWCESDVWEERTATFTPTRNYITICSAYNVNDYFYIKDIQLEEGSVKTSYEPFKSNSLTAKEDVVLRGFGGAQDTLDITTREKVERIGEIVLDGSDDEGWKKDSGNSNDVSTLFFSNIINAKAESGVCISDIMPSLNGFTSEYGNDGIFIDYVSDLDIRISNSKLVSNDVSGFRQWLSQNPITIQYKLKTPVIKTVDLSSNHVYSYDNITHYDCSSAEGSLVPTLSLDVPTKLNALVARQKDTIQELTQENESLKAAQQILLNSQLSFYETLVSAIPALMPVEGGQAIIPDFIQDLYRLEKNQK